MKNGEYLGCTRFKPTRDSRAVLIRNRRFVGVPKFRGSGTQRLALGTARPVPRGRAAGRQQGANARAEH
jgi:hypothetical protein